MKIAFRANADSRGSGPSLALLADDSQGYYLLDLRINGRRAVQMLQLFRAPNLQTKERGNRSTTITFHVERTYPNSNQSGVAILDALDKLGGDGILVLSATDGNTNTQRFCKGTLEVVDSGFVRGKTAFFSYSFIGGAISPTDPET